MKHKKPKTPRDQQGLDEVRDDLARDADNKSKTTTAPPRDGELSHLDPDERATELRLRRQRRALITGPGDDAA